MLNSFNIYNKDNQYVGSVEAKSLGEAANKAIARKYVDGRKQIGRIDEIEYVDPYDQTFEDIYG